MGRQVRGRSRRLHARTGEPWPTPTQAGRTRGQPRVGAAPRDLLLVSPPSCVSPDPRARMLQVGAKSRNLADLRGRLPEWIHLPTSVALPFGTFDQVLAAPQNRAVAAEVKTLSAAVKAGQHEKLGALRAAVLELAAPEALVTELRAVFQGAGLPWPGDAGEERWEAAWRAIKKVSPTRSSAA